MPAGEAGAIGLVNRVAAKPEAIACRRRSMSSEAVTVGSAADTLGRGGGESGTLGVEKHIALSPDLFVGVAQDMDL